MYNSPPTSTMGAERVLRTRFSDVNCSYRHSYPGSNTIVAQKKCSASIPINRDAMRKTASDHQMAQDEAEADYKDFVFFTRVVDGISKQNSLLKDGSYLKSTNELLIDNIVRARHELQEDHVEDDDIFHNHYYYPSEIQQTRPDSSTVTPPRDASMMGSLHHAEADLSFSNHCEDEGIFDFEL